MNLELVTPVILTSNEEVNIQRTLNALPWAETVVVLDSFSSDHTEAICRKFKNVRFQQRQFTTHSEQWNAAVQLASTPWILSLDADYQVSSNLLNKIKELEPSLSVKGYAIPFLFAVNGISLRAHLLPPRIALFEKAACKYIQDGHPQDLQDNGEVEKLSSPFIHDDRKPFERWFAAQIKYAELEVNKLSSLSFAELSPQDQLRYLIFPAPILVLFYTLLYKGLLFEGPPGWNYSFHRFLAEAVLSVLLIQKHLD